MHIHAPFYLYLKSQHTHTCTHTHARTQHTHTHTHTHTRATCAPRASKTARPRRRVKSKMPSSVLAGSIVCQANLNSSTVSSFSEPVPQRLSKHCDLFRIFFFLGGGGSYSRWLQMSAASLSLCVLYAYSLS